MPENNSTARAGRGAAQTLHPLVRALLADAVPIRIRCWDGSAAGPQSATVRVTINRRRGLRRLLWAPNELGLARAYVAGDIEIDGDLFDTLAELDRIAHPSSGAGLHVDRSSRRDLLRAALRLRILGPPPRPPVEETRLGGRRHSPRRDAQAIAHHYDLGNDFYALVLGESMTYSCAYWADPSPGPGGLTKAQIAKCDLIARKLDLRPGMRLLDVGCGWGTFVRHAAHSYGVTAVGVTLSHAQADFARKRVAEQGLTGQVEIRVQDYRDIHDGPYDAIASIGMAEHVGLSMLPTYAADLFALLPPGGRLLNHAIARRPGRPAQFTRTSFIDRYVFPDGELEPIGVMVGAIEEAGFDVRDVQSLREHYALTLRAWVANLERNWDAVLALVSPGRARVWRLYMAASALAFEAGRIGVNQVLAVRRGADGASGMPLVRPAY